jgi:hypothetical protein
MTKHEQDVKVDRKFKPLITIALNIQPHWAGDLAASSPFYLASQATIQPDQ